MINENFNRPKIVRWIEYIRFGLTKKPHTLGIMQVTSSNRINDEQSISLATNKIISDCDSILQKYADNKESFSLETIVGEIAGKYNKDDGYVYEVEQIFSTISDIEKATVSFRQYYKHLQLRYDNSNRYYPFSFNN